jgi:hypothetical protein
MKLMLLVKLSICGYHLSTFAPSFLDFGLKFAN